MGNFTLQTGPCSFLKLRISPWGNLFLLLFPQFLFYLVFSSFHGQQHLSFPLPLSFLHWYRAVPGGRANGGGGARGGAGSGAWQRAAGGAQRLWRAQEDSWRQRCCRRRAAQAAAGARAGSGGAARVERPGVGPWSKRSRPGEHAGTGARGS
jgi:hypothetical protein